MKYVICAAHIPRGFRGVSQSMHSQSEKDEQVDDVSGEEGDTISPPPIQPMIQADRRTQLSISPAGTWRYLESLTGLLVPRGVAPLRWRADGGVAWEVLYTSCVP